VTAPKVAHQVLVVRTEELATNADRKDISLSTVRMRSSETERRRKVGM